MSHASITLASSSAASGRPEVVVAVTVITITVVAGSMDARSTLVRSCQRRIANGIGA